VDTRKSSAIRCTDHPEVLAGDPFPHAATRGEAGGEGRNCFYCLEGWVILGSLDHAGEEVFDAVRCGRCDGKGLKTA
jgi:hypothetical protein